jgi:hypothetical protein
MNKLCKKIYIQIFGSFGMIECDLEDLGIDMFDEDG